MDKSDNPLGFPNLGSGLTEDDFPPPPPFPVRCRAYRWQKGIFIGPLRIVVSLRGDCVMESGHPGAHLSGWDRPRHLRRP